MSNRRSWLRGLVFWSWTGLAGLYLLAALVMVWIDVSGSGLLASSAS